eukprot:5744302-Pyramimonas_sp.AAC.1
MDEAIIQLQDAILDQIEETEEINTIVCDAVKNNFGTGVSAVEIQQQLVLRGMHCTVYRAEGTISEWVPLGFVVQVGDTYTFVDR